MIQRGKSSMLLLLMAAPLLIPETVWAFASAAQGSSETLAAWLSQQLQRPVSASQILLSPQTGALEGCTIGRPRASLSRTTSLSLRCPSLALPQLIVLNISDQPATSPATSSSPSRTTNPVVRRGATLNADWRTTTFHAQIPATAIDAGAAGDEIRIRIAHCNRVLRALVVDARHVSVLVPGA